MQLVHTEKDGVVTYRLYVAEEDIPVRGNAMASGDDDLDKDVEDGIIERLNDGDMWAWCQVVVKAEVNGITGQDSFGCCSYKDTSDFIQPGGYYDDMKKGAYADMKKGAYADLVNECETACATLQLLRS